MSFVCVVMWHFGGSLCVTEERHRHFWIQDWLHFVLFFVFFSRLCQQPTVHSCSVIFSSHLNVVDVHPYKLLQNHTNLFNSCFLFMMCPAPVFWSTGIWWREHVIPSPWQLYTWWHDGSYHQQYIQSLVAWVQQQCLWNKSGLPPHIHKWVVWEFFDWLEM